ncbi:DUF1508 domain-containing protein [Sphingosinicellaceae bacterium]|nr:DUF1508 domain-containing protein [Sphingosinicellaceae bacterium]
MNYYHLYRDTISQWRWRYVASNGKIIAVSSEAYVAKSDALYGITLMRGSASSPIHE